MLAGEAVAQTELVSTHVLNGAIVVRTERRGASTVSVHVVSVEAVNVDNSHKDWLAVHRVETVTK